MITLDPHQRKAIDEMHTKNGVCFVQGSVGCGKTIIALTYVQEVRARKVLILCPKRNTDDPWRETIDTHYKDTAQFIILNYEQLLKDDVMRKLINDMPDVIIADEAVRVKSGTGKMAKRFRKLQSRYRIALADNLIPNDLWEMYSPVSWFAPDTLGASFWKFKDRFCIMNPYVPQQIIGYRDRDKLEAYFEKFTVHVDWDPSQHLPQATREIVRVQMRDDEREAFARVHKECMIELKSGERITIVNVLSKIVRLMQLVNDPELFGFPAGSKEDALRDLLAQESGKVIIFSEQTQVLERLQKKCGGSLFTGKLTSKQAQKARKEFEEDSQYLWASSSGSRGLNLQNVAHTVIHYGLPYTNDALKQRFGRIYRRGAEKEVREVILLSEGSRDERLWEIIKEKKKLGDKFTKHDYLNMLV